MDLNIQLDVISISYIIFYIVSNNYYLPNYQYCVESF
eukprot:UN08058